MRTRKTYQESEPSASPAQLKHVLIDVDFFDKPKIKGLIYSHTQISALYLIRIYMALSRATGAVIGRDAALSIAYEMRIENEATAILDYCIANDLLETVDDGATISQQRTREDQLALAKKRAKIAERVTDHRCNALQERYKSVTDTNSNALQERYPDTVSVYDPDLDLKKEGGAGETPERIELNLDPIAIENLKCSQGPAVVQRAIELAEAHINAQRGTPDFHRLRRAAQNGCDYLRAWALSKARQQLDAEAAASDKRKRSKPPDYRAEQAQQFEDLKKWAKEEAKNGKT